MLGKPPKMLRDVRRVPGPAMRSMLRGIDLVEAACRLLRFPAVADKTFLITIGDRTVGGMISRDPMVGPWQVPVGDVAVTIGDYTSTRGEAMAMGERTPLALLDAPRPGAWRSPRRDEHRRRRSGIGDVRLSANWMAAVRRARRRRGSLRDGASRRRGTVPGARHRDSGRQGLAVDEDELERRRAARGRAAVADRLGVRAGARCPPHADAATAHRSRRHVAAC